MSSAITSGTPAAKTRTRVYFVLTSADVNATSGFCTQYCGWHTHGTIYGLRHQVLVRRQSGSLPIVLRGTDDGPNGNAGADGMASIIAHELEEAVTDPDLNAWYDNRGRGKCGQMRLDVRHDLHRVERRRRQHDLGTSDYLIQRNWVNSGSDSAAHKLLIC